AGGAARGDEDDLPRRDVVQRGDLAGIRVGGDLVHLGDEEWIGPAGDHRGVAERADGGVKDVVAVAEVVKDVRHDRRVEPPSGQAGQRGVPRAHQGVPGRTRIFTWLPGSSRSSARPPLTAAPTGIRSLISGAARTAPRPSRRSAMRKSSSQTCDSEPMMDFSPMTRSSGATFAGRVPMPSTTARPPAPTARTAVSTAAGLPAHS